MSLITRLVGRGRRFYSQVELRNCLADMFDEESYQNFITSEMLLIFEGREQHTWFCATSQALYCVFDVITEPEPRVKWRISKEHLVENNRLVLKLKVAEQSPVSGLITVNGKPPRKFTKRLFSGKGKDISYYVRIMLYKAFEIPIENWERKSETGEKLP